MDSNDVDARRRRWWIAGGVVALVVVIVGLVLAARSGDDDQVATVTEPPSATTPDTTAPATTAPTSTEVAGNTTTTQVPSSAPATSTPATEPLVTTTTTPAAAPDPAAWLALCTDRAGDPAATYRHDPSHATFGPLGSRPALQITVPGIQAEGYVAAPILSVMRAPGGTVVLAKETSPEAGWMLAVVDDDASIRWRRCVPGPYPGRLYGVPSGSGAAAVYLQTFAGPTPSWRAFDVTTGADLETVGELTDTRVIAESAHYLLLGPADDSHVISPEDSLKVLDLASGAVTPVPYPERAAGQESFRLGFEIQEVDGQPVLMHVEPEAGTVGTFVDGEWRTDEASIRATAPTRLEEDYGNTLSAIDPVGNAVWTIPFVSVSGEGFRYLETDGVVLANLCVSPPESGICEEGSMIGIDMATGEQLWQIPDFRSVSASGDGLALISSGDQGYVLIDVTTGERVDAPEENSSWADPDAFRTGCCGEGEYVWVGRDGGVVIAVDNQTVNVWFPAASEASQSLSASLID